MKPELIELSVNNISLRGWHQKPFYLSKNIHDPFLMIFCHGIPFNDAHQDLLFEKLQNICARIGLSSLRFHFRGCGQSEGEEADITLQSMKEDLSAIYEWAEAQGYEKTMFTTEGLGSVPVLLDVTHTIYAGAFLWPIFDTRDYAERNFDARAHIDMFDQGGFLKINGHDISIQLVKQLYELDLAPALEKVRFPVLIQHGAKDETVPIEHLDLARAHMRNRRIELTTYQDGTHTLPKESHRKYLMYHYEQFVQKYI